MRFVVLSVLIWVSIGRLAACSCGDPAPPCAIYFQTPLIFVGRVGEPPARSTRTFDSEEESVYSFEVEEFYRGGDRIAGIARVHSGPGMCGPYFYPGEQYLVYAYADQFGRYWTNICTRTAKTADAMEDLKFLRNNPEGQWPPRLFGRVTRDETGATDADLRQPQPGAHITLQGSRGVRYSLQADELGRFEHGEISPGTYKATAEWSEFLTNYTSLVRVPDSGCVEYNPVLRWNGTIRIRLEGEIESAVSSGTIRLPDYETGRLVHDVSSWTPSESRGSRTVEFQAVPPGRYVVVFNPSGDKKWDVPYGRLYAPGVTQLADAAVIELSVGRRTHQAKLVLPPVQKTLSGQEP